MADNQVERSTSASFSSLITPVRIRLQHSDLYDPLQHAVPVLVDVDMIHMRPDFMMAPWQSFNVEPQLNEPPVGILLKKESDVKDDENKVTADLVHETTGTGSGAHDPPLLMDAETIHLRPDFMMAPGQSFSVEPQLNGSPLQILLSKQGDVKDEENKVTANPTNESPLTGSTASAPPSGRTPAQGVRQTTLTTTSTTPFPAVKRRDEPPPAAAPPASILSAGVKLGFASLAYVAAAMYLPLLGKRKKRASAESGHIRDTIAVYQHLLENMNDN